MSVWREPRVLWSVASTRTDTSSVPRTIRFDREHFRVYDRVFEAHYLLVAPINYLFDRIVLNAGPTPPWAYQNDASAALRRTKLHLSFPHRNVLTFSPFAAPGALQGLWDRRLHTGWWDFDYGLTVTADDAIEVELGVHHEPLNSILGLTEFDAALAFDEQHSMHPFGRINRSKEVVVRSGSMIRPYFSYDNYLGNVSNMFPVGTVFDPNGAGKFSGIEFRKQRALVRSGDAAQITRFAAHIADGAWRQRLQAELSAFVNFSQSTVSSLFNRVPIRARHVVGGVEKVWWRPGAPVSLVLPSFGPALRHRFPRPLELKMGETLDVEMVTPPADASGDGIRVQLGVSLVGYARST